MKMFGRHFREESGPFVHSRFFDKGDLKYVILDLLKDKPAHGYEIIRALESRFHGFYTPSAGSVYPTLQLMEDLGYIKALEQDGKKVYTVTEEGIKFLKERKETVDKIKDHMRAWWGHGKLRDFASPIKESMMDLGEIRRSIITAAHHKDVEKLGKIKEIIAKARGDIQALINS
jgi:DNA-binding PadR family transcriptional regulator